MTVVNFGEAAEQVGLGIIWRAIKAGRMSSDRTNIGGFAIDLARTNVPCLPGGTVRAAGHDGDGGTV